MSKFVSKKEEFSTDGIDSLRVTTYGSLSKKNDVVLLAQHDGKSRQLVPRINGSLLDGSKDYEDYLRIDRDAGTPELAHAIADGIIGTSGDLRVQVVEVLYERGILDPNRIAGLSIRKFLNIGANPELRELLIRLHAQASVVCNSSLLDILETNGLFVDLHSMAPYDPLSLGEEAPGTLADYNSAYSSRSRRGSRRSLDVITDIPGEKRIAHPVLVRNMLARFDAFGVPTKLNDPYPKLGMPARNIMSARYMEAYPGVALDFTKDTLSRLEAEVDGWDIANLETDLNKVEMVAGIVSAAIVESLWEIRS
jgi:hypothetical protein